MNAIAAGACSRPWAAVAAPRRAGFIIPSSNRRFEPEAWALLPPAIVPHVARARITGPAHTAAAQLMPRVLDAAGWLADARCDLVFLHCTAFSMELGPRGERAMLDELAGAGGGARAGSTGLAVLAAMAALGSRQVSVLTPYDAAVTDDEASYLAAAGLTVLGAQGRGLAGTDAYCGTPPAYWRDALRAHAQAHRAADTILLSCANIRCLEALDDMEAAAGRPVVTSNQAALWYAARQLGHAGALPGLGCLARAALPREYEALQG